MTHVLTYRMKLTTPLVLTAAGGDPNSADTHLFIPGSAIRGALASEYLNQNRLGDAAGDPDFRQLFLSGDVRFLNCYPQNDNGRRLMPAPLSLKVEKRVLRKVYDLSSMGHEDAYWDSEGSPRQLMNFQGQFVFFSSSIVFHFNPLTTVNFHHQRERKAGRPREGSIFTYVSLQEGQQFIGHILMDEDRSQDIEPLLREKCHIGRSNRTEYGGGIEIEIIERKDRDSWTESEEIDGDATETERLVVTLLSDYIHAKETGQATTDGLIDVLIDEGIQVVSHRSFVRYGIQGGYLSVWHLPLPQTRSLCAGSVLVLQVAESPDQKVLDRLEWEGIGARRVEGFGRVCFNRHGQKKEYSSSLISFNPPPISAPSDSEADQVLCAMRKQLFRQTMDRRLLNKAEDLLDKDDLSTHRLQVSSSLLGRLRARVRTAENPEEIQEWLSKCRQKKAEKTLNQAHIKDGIAQMKPLSEWIPQFLGSPSGESDARVWDCLGARSACAEEALFDEKEKSLPLLDDSTLIWTYQQLFLDALLGRMMDHVKGD